MEYVVQHIMTYQMDSQHQIIVLQDQGRIPIYNELMVLIIGYVNDDEHELMNLVRRIVKISTVNTYIQYHGVQEKRIVITLL